MIAVQQVIAYAHARARAHRDPVVTLVTLVHFVGEVVERRSRKLRFFVEQREDACSFAFDQV